MNIYAEHLDGSSHLNIGRAQFSLWRTASGGEKRGTSTSLLGLEVVCFSAGNSPEVCLVINPAVHMFFIYSTSYASFGFLQILSSGGSQPLVVWSLQKLLLTAQGEPRELRSSINTKGDHSGCLLLPFDSLGHWCSSLGL